MIIKGIFHSLVSSKFVHFVAKISAVYKAFFFFLWSFPEHQKIISNHFLSFFTFQSLRFM